MPGTSFFAELRRRKVVQVAAIYGAVAWGVTEIVVTVVEQLFLPQWVSTLTVILFVVGFPVAMFLAWTFDITAEGITRTAVSSRRGKASIALSTVLLVFGTAGLFLLIRPSLQLSGSSALPAGFPPNSMAVLPFEDAGLGAEHGHLSNILSDEVRDQLGRVSGLRIAARSSSIAVLARAADARSRSEELGVAMLVEGSLRRRGQKLNVSVQLIEGSSGLLLWNESFDREPRELLALQQAIVEGIVRSVVPDAEGFVAEPPTRSVSANEFMLIARDYEQKVRDREEVDTAMLDEAIRLYREATLADPESALAQSRLAGVLIYAGELNAAEGPIFRALTLDPELAEVHYTLGLYYWARGLPGARAAFKRAVDLNPNNPDALEYYANSTLLQGQSGGMDDLLRRAVELDPLRLHRYGILGVFLGIEFSSGQAIEVARRVEDLFDGPDAFRVIALILEAAGRVDEAIAWTIRARDLEPDNPDHVQRLAELYAVIGDFETALRLEPEPGVGLLYRMRRYDELIEVGEFLMIEEPQDMVLRYLLAFAYNATGQFERALRVLESTGLPGTVLEEARTSTDLEGFISLINAAYGAGDVGVARKMAEFWRDREQWVNTDWWRDTYRACVASVLGDTTEVLVRLTRVRGSARVPVQSVLRDSVCFRAFADEPVYLETLRVLDAHERELRERLPATLAEFGVKL